MSMQRIRDLYGVPAKRGMVVLFQGEPVTITGTTRSALHLRARRENGQSIILHPTWAIEYPAVNAPHAPVAGAVSDGEGPTAPLDLDELSRAVERTLANLAWVSATYSLPPPQMLFSPSGIDFDFEEGR